MSRNFMQSTSLQADLMKRVLEVRYTDIEEEKRLCKELLDVSETEQYYYGSAFANIYLLDGHLALGEYESCDFYLLRGARLCREHGFDDLLMVLCNCAGLYYQKLNDDQSALNYFLEGGHLAEKANDSITLGKFYNNIGYSFGRNGDYEDAKKYFELACQTIDADGDDGTPHRAATYLINLAEICRSMEDVEGSLAVLKRCEALGLEDIYSRLRQECGWCAYYVISGQPERCIEIVDRLLSSHMLEVEDQFFICDMIEGLCGGMLEVGDLTRARLLLDILLHSEYSSSLSLRFRVVNLKIRCWEAFGETEKLKQEFLAYFELSKELARIEDQTSAQSMMSKINIYEASLERASMLEKVHALENASQLDELTGLYNRRYFNKLVSKIFSREDTRTLGVLMLDVDYFKQYNDFYGHFKGDDALRTVAKVLTDCARGDIYVSRYGGDEFICLCVNLSDDDVEDYTRRLIQTLREKQLPHEKNPVSGLVSVSVGYCNEAFVRGLEPSGLIALADQALYLVKQRERGGCARKKLHDGPAV